MNNDINKMKSPMRKSQQQIFWRNHRVIELKIDGKSKGWFGIKIPKNAQKIVEETK